MINKLISYSQKKLLAKKSIFFARNAARSQDWWKAQKYYAKALAYYDNSPKIWIQFGNALIQSGKINEATKAYTKAVELEPTADGYLQLGRSYKLQGMHSNAVEAWRKALSFDAVSMDTILELENAVTLEKIEMSIPENMEIYHLIIRELNLSPDKIISSEEIEILFQKILKRKVGNEDYKREIVNSGKTIGQMIKDLIYSEEYMDKLKIKHTEFVEPDAYVRKLTKNNYRNPKNLSIIPIEIDNVILIGSCLVDPWENLIGHLDTNFNIERYGVGAPLPDAPQKPLTSYNFQLVQLPLRSIIPDMAFARLSEDDVSGHENLLDYGKSMIKNMLSSAMKWNEEYGTLTFVMSFIEPQKNHVGVLMNPYSLSNPQYFVHELNIFLYKQVKEYKNSYYYDVNDTMKNIGLKYNNEDIIAAFNHGSFIFHANYPEDKKRIEKTTPAPETYNSNVLDTVISGWNDLIAMYRIVKQIDAIKMVVIDLDDTLWRGIVGENDGQNMPTTEGWPKAFWETLLFLKRRGVILAIISKNEEETVKNAWDHIVGNLLPLDSFAIYRINWKQKAENMSEILQHVNLLPQNVVYIDDNPAQRADIKKAFPDIRVMGGDPIHWRHILLNATETQVAHISQESSQRTEMVRAQVTRETMRKNFSQEEFIASLNVTVDEFIINDTSHEKFMRSFELINKTNQFNTTGKRWTREEVEAGFSSGMKFYSFVVSDNFTQYGLVAVLIVRDNTIIQYVMSCRVMGIGVEKSVINMTNKHIFSRNDISKAIIVNTPKNLPCRNVYKNNLYSLVSDDGSKQVWMLESKAI
ncbi:HAD-IIIC family phosphatase [Komagataeibacter swingsii]|uniref:HAD-IIIC family phosphatase n=1 Tax=Komagataeibacter swingsii TaxID=215220 RepID=A0A850P8B8_9PROT|nr:HAD-IIIC family phosphatase [Komagataeibacter swingsii]NVN38112.1 HAD-IIIC family phosphatase [Komagataeibacter swingsii]